MYRTECIFDEQIAQRSPVLAKLRIVLRFALLITRILHQNDGTVLLLLYCLFQFRTAGRIHKLDRRTLQLRKAGRNDAHIVLRLVLFRLDLSKM